MKAYRALFGILAWGGLLLQYWLLVLSLEPELIGTRTVQFFSYFTIITNTMAALAFTLPLVAPDGIGRWWSQPSVRGGITVFIVVVMIVFHFILRGLASSPGIQVYINAVMHYIVPTAMALDWLLFVPKGALKWRTAVKWLAVPALYGVWTLVHGAISGFYPYPFMNAAKLGYPQVTVNMVGLALGFLAPGLILVGLDRLLSRGRSTTGDSAAASP